MDSTMRPTLLLVFVLAACGSHEGPDPLTKLHILRDSIMAEQIRRDAECRAQAVEMATQPDDVRIKLAELCEQVVRLGLEVDAETLRNIDRSIAELSR